MPSSQERSNELAVLMQLRLAFGPGTRLWSLKSREEICYDWLHYKARQREASFRDFALRLYAAEQAESPRLVVLYEIRRRLARVLKAYRIGKRAGVCRAALAGPQARLDASNGQASLPHLVPTSEVATGPAELSRMDGFPMRPSEMPR